MRAVLACRAGGVSVSMALGLTLAGCTALLGDFTIGEGADGAVGAEGGVDADTDAIGVEASTNPDATNDASGQADGGADAGGGSSADGSAGDGSAGDAQVPPADGGASADGAAPPVGSDAGPGAEGGGGGGSPGSDAGGPDADAGPWSPPILDQEGSLALWLESSSSNIVLSSGVVGIWTDLSKNHNDAKATSNGPPVDTAVVNGHDAVHFNARGVSLTIADAASLQFGTDQIYIAVVARASAGSGYFFSKATDGTSGAGPTYASGLEFFVRQTTTDAGATLVSPSAHVDPNNQVDWTGPAFEDGHYHVVALRRPSAGTLTITVDSQAAFTGSTGGFDVSQAGKSVTVGGLIYGNFAAPVDLDVAELLVIHPSSGIVADADVAHVTAYLQQKYGL